MPPPTERERQMLGITAEIRSINALRAEREDDNTLLSPVEALQDAIADIQDPKNTHKPTKLVIIGLNNDESYDVSFWLSNIKASEVLALLEYMKADMLDCMRGE